MNLMQLVLSIGSFNLAYLLIIVFTSSKLENLNILTIGSFLLIPLTAWLGMLLQSVFNISDVADRQLVANVLLTFWALKFCTYNRSFKLVILRYLLNKNLHLRGLNLYEKTKNLVFFIVCLMIVLMPVVSLNFLSGNSGLEIVDILAALMFLFGAGYEVKALNELKKSPYKLNAKLHQQGLWFLSRHPDLLGQLISWWGIYFLALGAYGGEWSFLGPVLTTYLYVKYFVTDAEKKLTIKYDDYISYKASTPSILPKITFLKS